MKDNFIQLEDDEILRFGIKDRDGNPTGEYIELNCDDLELPLRYQEMSEQLKKNYKNLRNEIIIIEKRQDVKGKKLFSKNEEDTLKALEDYYKKQAETYNMFLGENGVEKLLAGRKLGWTTLDSIDKLIEKEIAPHFDNSMNKLTKKIKDKYKKKETTEEQIEVVE